MSDSIIQTIQRMDQIRSRIDEIRKLGTGQKPERADAVSGSAGTAATAGGGTEQFALLLEEAQASLFQDQTEPAAAGSSLASLLSNSGTDTPTGGTLSETVLNQLIGSSQGAIDPALIARALELYKAQK